MSGLNRVVVVGSSGSGKTTVAREVAVRRGLPNLEMDSVRHANGWDSTPEAEFQRIPAEFTSQDRWVVDGNYPGHGIPEIVWPRADTFVWTDPPKRVVMSRVIRRTLTRMITGEELWHGLREPKTNLYSLDPYKNIIVWTWTRYDRIKERYERVVSDGTWDHAAVHRLQTRRDVNAFLDVL